MSVREGATRVAVVVIVIIACCSCGAYRRRWRKLCASKTFQQLIFIVRIFSCIVENVCLKTLKREMDKGV